MTDTPVLLVIWKRPDTTRKVLEKLARVKPSTLVVASDGPATVADEDAINQTRALFDQLSWPCNIIRQYSDFNMGLAWRVSSAIDFAFTHFEKLIILEDDIVADESFFQYCEELLARFSEEKQVMAIRGTSHRFVAGEVGAHSYGFTRFMVPWGWATWKRAWSGFDHSFFGSRKARFMHRHSNINLLRQSWKQLPFWSKIRNNPELAKRLESCGDRYAFWLEMCDRQLRLNSWAGLFAMWILEKDGLVLTPAVNMIENIGFRDDAVNTRASIKMPRATVIHPMPFPLVHPVHVSLNESLQLRMAVDTDKTWTDGARLFYKRFKPEIS